MCSLLRGRMESSGTEFMDLISLHLILEQKVYAYYWWKAPILLHQEIAERNSEEFTENPFFLIYFLPHQEHLFRLSNEFPLNCRRSSVVQATKSSETSRHVEPYSSFFYAPKLLPVRYRAAKNGNMIMSSFPQMKEETNFHVNDTIFNH